MCRPDRPDATPSPPIKSTNASTNTHTNANANTNTNTHTYTPSPPVKSFPTKSP